MKIVKKPLTNGQYVTDEFVKTSIFLHHTCGLTADSAWRWWNVTPDRVGTPYIIDRDGTVVECFDPKYWAYHIGLKKDDNYHEKHSVNIELVSAGPLRFEEGKYRFYPLWPNRTRFTVIKSDEVVEFKNLWRDNQFYHKYTEKQVESLKSLIEHLLEKFPGISLEHIDENFYQYNEKVVTDRLPGIWAHTTVRVDKSDIYPDERIKGIIKDLIPKKESINKTHKKHPKT